MRGGWWTACCARRDCCEVSQTRRWWIATSGRDKLLFHRDGDIAIYLLSLEGGVVDEDFAGEGLEDLLFGLLVGGVVFEFGESAAVGESHEEGEVKGIVDGRAVARHGAPVANRPDEVGGFLKLFRGADEGGTVFGVPGALQPDKHGVFDPAAGGCGSLDGLERDKVVDRRSGESNAVGEKKGKDGAEGIQAKEHGAISLRLSGRGGSPDTDN